MILRGWSSARKVTPTEENTHQTDGLRDSGIGDMVKWERWRGASNAVV